MMSSPQAWNCIAGSVCKRRESCSGSSIHAKKKSSMWEELFYASYNPTKDTQQTKMFQ